MEINKEMGKFVNNWEKASDIIKTNKKEMLSIGLTVYNHEKFLRQSIESILNQTYTNFELFIIDDFSTDRSWEIIKSYKDDRITAIRHEKNWGYSGFFEMVDHLRGDYIAVAHSDDCWEPDKLQKQVDFMNEHENFLACFTLVQLINEDGNLFNDYSHMYYGVFDKDNRSRFEWLHYFFTSGNCLCHPSVLFRKSWLEKYRAGVHGLSGVPDFFMWIQLCRAGEIWVLQERLTKFRIHEKTNANASAPSLKNQFRNGTEVFFILEEFIKNIERAEFCAIFPEVQNNEAIDDEVFIRYEYSQLLLKSGKRHYQLKGLEIIYSLFQSDRSRMELNQHYNYGKVEFANTKSEYDCFGFGENRKMTQSIFWDTGDGFSEENKISKEQYLEHNGQFEVWFELSCEKKPIMHLRFDPIETFCKCMIEEVQVNGETVEVVTNNSYSKKDGCDLFITSDPIYLIENKDTQIDKVKIKGTIDKLNMAELDLLLKENQIRNSTLQFELEEKNRQADEENRQLNEKSRQLGIEKEEILNKKNALEKEYTQLVERKERAENYFSNYKLRVIIKVILGRPLI